MIVNISLPNTSYDITIDKLQTLSINTKTVIVTNSTIKDLHIKYLLSKIKCDNISIVTLRDGEKYKNMETILEILDHCFEQKLNRNSLLIAFGGGVIGDMTGFASSIYQRGINFIQIPTTLLSQVDASVGGKTGINNKYGKNLIGAFHQPQAVYIDPTFLNTLPKREFSAGVAEIIKMAVCFDKDFFIWLQNNKLDNNQNITIAIEKSVKIKADVVSRDEKENGIRAALNYGHTFGHIVENETNYTQYLHGEAVGIGICMANKLSQKLGFMDQDKSLQIEKLLETYNIPTTYNIKDEESFYQHFFLDKKAMDDKIKFILAVDIGDCTIVDNVKKSEILSILKGYKL